MTKVLCSIHRECVYFECQGHSDYKNDEGYNDVCAEVSTLCSMLVRYIDSKGQAPITCEDGHVKIAIDTDAFEAEVFKAAMLEFTALAKKFPEHIKVY